MTGAFGFSGKYITQKLISSGKKVRTLTNHPKYEHSWGDQLEVEPLNLINPYELAEAVEGATTIYNTYWIRFPRGCMTFEQAEQNTFRFIKAAAKAGVKRFIHISITNPDLASPLPYFRGKARIEEAIRASGMSYAIFRPTVIFGEEDILINNIAWLLRHFPLFMIPGAGDYQIQPVFVEDLAEMMVNAGDSQENIVMDAVGPKIYTFRTLVELIARVVKSKARLINIHPQLALTLARLIGYFVADVVLTPQEMKGLLANLLVSREPPSGKTVLDSWLEQNASTIGRHYASELARHYRS